MTPPPPAARRCVCGQQVIVTSTRTLDAEPTDLGIYRADGAWLTAREKAIQRIPGHHTHACAGPRDIQQDLFAS